MNTAEDDEKHFICERCDVAPYPEPCGCCQFENVIQKLEAWLCGEIQMSKDEMSQRCFDIRLKEFCFIEPTSTEYEFLEQMILGN